MAAPTSFFGVHFVEILVSEDYFMTIHFVEILLSEDYYMTNTLGKVVNV